MSSVSTHTCGCFTSTSVSALSSAREYAAPVGFDGELRMTVGPADGAVFRFSGALPQVTFTWAPSGEAQEYRVVLATGPDLLEQALQSTEVRGQRAQLQPPDVGEYWWGVYQGGAAQAANGTL